MEYRGFIHQNPLMKNEVTFVPIRCEACGEFFRGTTSTCSECAFNIHESCVELPQEFQDPYHQHRLTLVKTNGMDHLLIKCLVYSENHFGFSFHCQNCNFDLDLKCAFQKLAIIEGQDLLHHLTNFHPLVATQKRQDNDDNDGDGVSCRICGEPTSGALYGCDLCNFYLHRSCAEFQLPTTLQHFYHPCLLTLSIDKEESNCNACGDSYDFYSYLCEPCL